MGDPMKKNHNANCTVLVCDDEKYIRENLRDYLENHGYKVVLASDGIECLEQNKNNKIDAILLDIIMPRMDGISVIRQLRKEGSNIPILVLSARHELGPSVETEELSLGQFIPKPIRLSEVEFLVETAIMEAQDAHRAHS